MGEIPQYFGITFPFWIIRWQWMRDLWRRFMCPRGCHLFDEVLSSPLTNPATGEKTWPHYLWCDCCGMTVNIESIEGLVSWRGYAS